MANVGMKEENTMLNFEISDIKLYIDLAKTNKNIIAYFPLSLNYGPKPINVGIFYNDQNKNNQTMFGYGFNLSEARTVICLGDQYKVVNPDGSENIFNYDTTTSEGQVYVDSYKNKLIFHNEVEFFQFKLKDKFNNEILFDQDSFNRISLISVLGKYRHSFAYLPNQIDIYNYDGIDIVLNNTNTLVNEYTYRENNNTVYIGYISYTLDRITRIRISKNNVDVKDILIDYTNGLTIKDNISKKFYL